MNNFGFFKTAAVSPTVIVGNPEANSKEIIRCIKETYENGASIAVFPELCVTGFTCGDLFFQEALYKGQLTAISNILAASKNIDMVIVLGIYVKYENVFYDCGAFIQNGKVLGLVPRIHTEFGVGDSVNRWFASGKDFSKNPHNILFLGETVPFGALIFRDNQNELGFGIEVGLDSAAPISPSAELAVCGAGGIFNPAATRRTVGSSDFRRAGATFTSGKGCCAYLSASSSPSESTTDWVYSGHLIISALGHLISENDPLSGLTDISNSDISIFESQIIYADIDFDQISYERTHSPAFATCKSYISNSNDSDIKSKAAMVVEISPLKSNSPLPTPSQTPFVPATLEKASANFKEIFEIQTAGLMRRITHTHIKKIVVGISGGLDSTLAILVAANAMRKLGRPASDVLAITMPGFGTTGKTYNNALRLMELLGSEIREISIKDSVLQHFKDINHDPNNHDITFENSQARERTQILMDVASKENGFVLGTGDLSEFALGWCTYNGDHMAMYGVNGSVPKTLAGYVIKWIIYSDLTSTGAELAKVLTSILETPISPELLPPDQSGNITQITEDNVGPYMLHDFFIYHTLRYGTEPQKLVALAESAFSGTYDTPFIKKWLTVFYRRFFNQQFKRSCSPDGVAVGSVGLSPRGGFIMPSDGDSSYWLSLLK